MTSPASIAERFRAGPPVLTPPLPLAALGAAFAAAGVLGASVATEKWFVVGGLLAGVSALVAIVHLRAVGLLLIVVAASGIRLPDSSGQLRLAVLLGVLIAAAAGVRYFLSERPASLSAAERWTLAFVAVLLVTMAVRGVGFRALGGDNVGGLIYVKVIASAAVAIVLPRLQLSATALRRAFLLGCALAFVPLAADLVAVYAPQGAGIVRRWVALSPSIEQALRGNPTGAGGLRLTSAMQASVFLTMAILLCRDATRPLTLRRAAIAAAAGLALAAFSGHRIALLQVLGIVGLAMMFEGVLRRRQVAIAALSLCAVLAVAVMVSPYLPLAVQRAISWIPGAAIADEVRRTSTDTILWRVAVWLVAAQDVPRYLLVGRGIAYSDGAVAAAANANVVADEPNWAIIAGYFHNGILSLLILLGVPGLLAGAGVCASGLRRAWTAARAGWRTRPLAALHRVLVAWLVVQVVEYWLLYGDVQVSFPDLFMTLGLLEAVRRADALPRGASGRFEG